MSSSKLLSGPVPRETTYDEMYLASQPFGGVERPPILYRGECGYTVARIDPKLFRYVVLGIDNNYYNFGRIVAALAWATRRELPDIVPTCIHLPSWLVMLFEAVDYGHTLYGYEIVEGEDEDIFLAEVTALAMKDDVDVRRR